MSEYSFDFPKGLMDGYICIHLSNFCSWGKCFRGFGGCANSGQATFSECRIWDIPKILQKVKQTLKQNQKAKIFLEAPNFFDTAIKSDKYLFQFQTLLSVLSQQNLGAYFSVQAVPSDLIFFFDEEDILSFEFVRNAGIQEIWLGVESANQELRHKYSKPYFENEALKKTILKAQKAGIQCCFYLIVSSEDTDKTIQETVDFVHEVKPAQICMFEAFHYTGGEHYVDWKNMQENLGKVARFQTILRKLAEEVNHKS